jgi:DNA-binding CsgD family transcriptional regulator
MDGLTLSVNASFFEHFDSPVLIADSGGQPVYCNDAFSNYIERPKDNILQSYTSDLGLEEHVCEKDLRGNQSLKQRVRKIPIELGDKTVSLFIVAGGPDFKSQHSCGCELGDGLPLKECRLKALSIRELEVLRLLVRGYSIKKAASLLGISDHTVAGHTKALHAKLKVRSRSAMLFYTLVNFRDCKVLGFSLGGHYLQYI